MAMSSFMDLTLSETKSEPQPPALTVMTMMNPIDSDDPFVSTDGKAVVLGVHSMAWLELTAKARRKMLFRFKCSGLSCMLPQRGAGATRPRLCYAGWECTYVVEGNLEDRDCLTNAGKLCRAPGWQRASRRLSSRFHAHRLFHRHVEGPRPRGH
jgi:hypothetical protein